MVASAPAARAATVAAPTRAVLMEDSWGWGTPCCAHHPRAAVVVAAPCRHDCDPVADADPAEIAASSRVKRRGNARVVTWRTSTKGETMKALVFGGPGQRSWDNVDDPGIQEPTDVIVKVDTTTICGTDLHILKGDVPAVTEGRILGHEAVGHGGRDRRRGVVAEGGRPGARARDHVLRALRPVQGRDGRALRGGRRDRLDLRPPDRRRAGRVRARARTPRRPCTSCPRASRTSRSSSSPTSSRRATRSASRTARVEPGDTIAVVGAGPVGLAAMMTARDRRRGPDHRGRHRRVTAQARAANFGATHTVVGGENAERRDPRDHRRRGRRRRDGGRRRPGDVRPLHADRPRRRHASRTSASTARRRRCTSRSCGSRTSRSPPAS